MRRLYCEQLKSLSTELPRAETCGDTEQLLRSGGSTAWNTGYHTSGCQLISLLGWLVVVDWYVQGHAAFQWLGSGALARVIQWNLNCLCGLDGQTPQTAAEILKIVEPGAKKGVWTCCMPDDVEQFLLKLMGRAQLDFSPFW